VTGLSVRVLGTPGPKGSVNAFCVRCAQRRLKQQIVIKEESDNGIHFRKLTKQALVKELQTLELQKGFCGGLETHLTVFIERRRQVRNGVETGQWVPSHESPWPIHQQSGDAEKHVRVLHDALQDAGVIANDSQVVRQISEKVWADETNPPGAQIEVIFL
jgi:Holliday junction resolvase RusA-like endonuclease